ncbi:hypothetical protein, partial [Akkermansia sp.]|uniref:hypothetical protein n=1 Tax=Akkermansia sp. TaxID=1872421 RepID=UPI0027B95D3E
VREKFLIEDHFFLPPVTFPEKVLFFDRKENTYVCEDRFYPALIHLQSFKQILHACKIFHVKNQKEKDCSFSMESVHFCHACDSGTYSPRHFFFLPGKRTPRAAQPV